MMDWWTRRSLRKSVDMYRRRIITQQEAVNKIAQDLDPGAIIEIMEMVPSDLRSALKAWVDAAPKPEDEWEVFPVFRVGPSDESMRDQFRSELRRNAEALR